MLLKYFWLGPPLFGVAFALFTKSRYRDAVHKDPSFAPLVKRLVIGILIFFIVPPLLLVGMQFLGSFDGPFFFAYESLTNPFVFAVWLAQLSFWILSLAWVWRGRGATVLLQYWTHAGGPDIKPIVVRLIVTAVVVVSATSAVRVRLDDSLAQRMRPAGLPNKRLNLTVRPVVRLAVSSPPSTSSAAAQGARPSRPAG